MEAVIPPRKVVVFAHLPGLLFMTSLPVIAVSMLWRPNALLGPQARPGWAEQLHAGPALKLGSGLQMWRRPWTTCSGG
jgi:hypothetical protein